MVVTERRRLVRQALWPPKSLLGGSFKHAPWRAGPQALCLNRSPRRFRLVKYLKSAGQATQRGELGRPWASFVSHEEILAWHWAVQAPGQTSLGFSGTWKGRGTLNRLRHAKDADSQKWKVTAHHKGPTEHPRRYSYQSTKEIQQNDNRKKIIQKNKRERWSPTKTNGGQ